MRRRVWWITGRGFAKPLCTLQGDVGRFGYQYIGKSALGTRFGLLQSDGFEWTTDKLGAQATV